MGVQSFILALPLLLSYEMILYLKLIDLNQRVKWRIFIAQTNAD